MYAAGCSVLLLLVIFVTILLVCKRLGYFGPCKCSTAQRGVRSNWRSRSVDCVMAACGSDDDIESAKQVVREKFGPRVRFFVYDKCKPARPGVATLPNVGREQHTYAYHVATHYHDLADTVVFTPANIYKHARNLVVNQYDGEEFTCHYAQPWRTVGRWAHSGIYEGRALDKANPRGVAKWSRKHIGYFPNNNPGLTCKYGLLISSRHLIRRTPQKRFEHIVRELSQPEPEATHYMERLVQALYAKGTV